MGGCHHSVPEEDKHHFPSTRGEIQVVCSFVRCHADARQHGSMIVHVDSAAQKNRGTAQPVPVLRCLLAGTAGAGKTTLALVCVPTVFQSDYCGLKYACLQNWRWMYGDLKPGNSSAKAADGKWCRMRIRDKVRYLGDALTDICNQSGLDLSEQVGNKALL